MDERASAFAPSDWTTLDAICEWSALLEQRGGSRPVRVAFAPARHSSSAMAAAVLSPHFDDAVLSCWHVLQGLGPVIVVNVFAGMPPERTTPGWWDRLTGAWDAAARVRERASEDRAALAVAGRVPVNLDLLEAQHRRHTESPAAIAGRIAAEVSGCDVVYAPAALAAHPDHALVRDAALCLRTGGARVLLYADMPHAIARGWPTWVASDGVVAVDVQWADALARSVIGQGVPRARVHLLGCLAQQRKLAALRTYRTQIAALEEMAFAPLERSLRYEVAWDLPPA
jgi:GlcNAc-PI de-N-acetylase